MDKSEVKKAILLLVTSLQGLAESLGGEDSVVEETKPAHRKRRVASTESPAEPTKVKRKPTKAPQEEDDDVDEDVDVASMGRAELIALATELGVDTRGKRMSTLRELVEKARASGAELDDDEDEEEEEDEEVEEKPVRKKISKKAAKKISKKKEEPTLSDLRAVAMEQFIEKNFDDYEEAIAGLGCEGICSKCPNPEKHRGGASQQVDTCWGTISADMEDAGEDIDDLLDDEDEAA